MSIKELSIAFSPSLRRQCEGNCAARTSRRSGTKAPLLRLQFVPAADLLVAKQRLSQGCTVAVQHLPLPHTATHARMPHASAASSRQRPTHQPEKRRPRESQVPKDVSSSVFIIPPPGRRRRREPDARPAVQPCAAALLQLRQLRPRAAGVLAAAGPRRRRGDQHQSVHQSPPDLLLCYCNTITLCLCFCSICVSCSCRA